jgi:hypothetical protein
MSQAAAPLWICFLPQLVSVTGDSFGQRSSRVYHHGNRRRFILSLVVVSCLQMFLVLSVIQIALPSTVTIIYKTEDHKTFDYCDLPGNEASEHCYAQGPLTIYKALYMCPMLLLDGLINIFYYIGEASMYCQPLGVLMLVLTALTSSFIIAPMQEWFDLKGAKSVSVVAILLGLVGAVVCLLERSVVDDSQDENGQPPTDENLNADRQSTAVVGQPPSSLLNRIAAHLPLLGPFVMLSFTYALYFVLMLYYNDTCKVNMWGYNAFDQVVLPLYIFPMFVLVEMVPPLNRYFDDKPVGSARPPASAYHPIATEDADDGAAATPTSETAETFVEAARHAWVELTENRCAGLLNMFIYRLLINARAMAYTYIAVRYNLSSSYLELTLIRVVLSWMASLGLVLVVPRFIDAAEDERRKLKDPVNIGIKVVGTALIVGSLLIINKDD